MNDLVVHVTVFDQQQQPQEVFKQYIKRFTEGFSNMFVVGINTDIANGISREIVERI